MKLLGTRLDKVVDTAIKGLNLQVGDTYNGQTVLRVRHARLGRYRVILIYTQDELGELQRDWIFAAQNVVVDR